MSSRSQALKLAAAGLLPVLLLALAGSAELVKRERAAFERGLQGELRALASAVDARTEGAVAALDALATSPALETGDLAAFREHAARLLRQSAAWSAIQLFSPSGEPLAGATRAGAALFPAIAARELVQRAAASQRPQIGDLAAPGGEPGFPIAVPVLRDGQARYVLAGFASPGFVDSLLRLQDFPAGWEVAVLDRGERVLARVPGGASAMSGGHTARRRSASTGWTVVATVPAAAVEAGASRTGWLFLGGSGVLALAMGLVWLLTRPSPPAPLPRNAANDAALEASRAVVRPAGSERRKRSVLVADPSAELRRTLLLAFAGNDHRVYGAADGAEALALAHDVRPDMALIDIRLPRVPGYDVAKQLRHQYGRTVWLVALGGAHPEDRARSIAAGFDDHVAKPVTQQALDAMLRSGGERKVSR